jgi:hypothetical protein
MKLAPETMITKYIDEIRAWKPRETIRSTSNVPIAVAEMLVIQPGYQFDSIPVHPYRDKD